MKILYAAGPRIGAGIQLRRYLKYNEHEIKIASYLKSGEEIKHIDWTLDALFNKYAIKQKNASEMLGCGRFPEISADGLESLIEDIDEYGPDLVISDGELITSCVAKFLGIKLWYCSPLHILGGVKWSKGQIEYKYLFLNYRQDLLRYPEADRTFIYSPFGEVIGGPELKDGHHWVRPYHLNIEKDSSHVGIGMTKDREEEFRKIIKCIPPYDLMTFGNEEDELYQLALSNCKWMLSSGETGIISDAMYGGVEKICVSPNLKDLETLLNSILCKQYGVGDNIGQIEYMDHFGIDVVERSYESEEVGYSMRYDENIKYLHEEVENEICSI